MNKKFYSLIALFLIFAGAISAQIETITDDDLVGGNTYNWTANIEYQLDGYVYLESGGVLNIEPGTVIKGLEVSTTGDPSALIITRGAQIFAEGTATNPIIFTSTADDGTLDETANGLWGGLVILGNGTVARPGGTDFIEGIPNEPRTEYGGGATPNDTENSGVLKYISIRHGGAELAPGSEINGLTLGAVGSGTELDYIEVFANSDDGIEWFGGQANVKHLIAAFCGDDGMDYDFGWRGKGQYWLVIQRSDLGGNGGEHDGANPDGQAPFSKPTIYNATYIGSGAASNQVDNEFGILMRDNAGGTYANSIFTDFADKALSIEDLAPGEPDSYNNLVNGDLVFKNNVWFGFGAGATLDDIVDTYASGDDPTSAAVKSHLTNNTNQLVDPQIAGISRTANGMLDPRLNAGSPALTLGDAPTDDFFDQVFYHGAFNNSSNWALGWTALDQKGYFGDLVTPVQGTTICVQDNDLLGGQTYNWTKDNVYCLDGYVYLEAGGVLNIEAGTTIYGMEQSSTGDPSALIITRGAQINAQGTAAEPIVFTAEGVHDGSIQPDQTVNGLWGGLVLLGNGTVARPGGTDFIEGIPDEPRTEYGGGATPNDTESSGILEYVSIRHGGAELAPGNEINGLTLGGVGSGTQLNFIEVYANADDGIEWFGGTAEVKHLISAFCGDDGMDYDFGWRGKGQYWLVIQRSDLGGNGGEHDGANPDGQAPFSKPTIYNATYIGSGAASNQVDNEFGILMRDNAGGTYANSIFIDFADRALSIEDLAPGEPDSYNNLVNGDIVFKNNIWFGFGAGTTLDDIVDTYASGDDPTSTAVKNHLANNTNDLVDPNIASIDRTAGSNLLDPRLNGTSPALSAGDIPTDPFFDITAYHGAFDNSNNWAAGWTALEEYEHFGDIVTPVTGQTICVQDGDLLGNQTYNWTKNNVYCLDGYVYLEAGGVLNIEAGTTIYGMESSSTGEASALIITRGAQIFANGNPAEPIIFTAEAVHNGTIAPDETVNGLWGGLVLLGNGTVARPNGTDFIEGIPDEPRTEFGGGATPDDTENSGQLTYVSIRHGGAELAPGSEINGLTLGAIGSGTLIDYVEVFANSDDGIEWFGGQVNVNHAISAFCGDDGMDYDFGWSGKGQYWLVIQRSDLGGNGGEHDGANPDGQTPFSNPTIFNATYIGSGVNSQQVDNEFGLLFRDRAGGTYANSIFTDFADKALSIEDLDGGGDSHENLVNGDLNLLNNYWWEFGAGTTLTDLVDTYASGDDPDASDVIAHLTTNSNVLENPMLCGIDRVKDGVLNPLLAAGSPAIDGGIIPTDAFFDNVAYHGAFDDANNWAKNWTALDAYGFLFDGCTTSTNDPFAQDNGFILNQNAPNPAIEVTSFEFVTPSKSNILMEVYDLNGRRLATLVNDQFLAGRHTVDLDVSNFANGTYFVTLQSDSVILTRKMTVLK